MLPRGGYPAQEASHAGKGERSRDDLLREAESPRRARHLRALQARRAPSVLRDPAVVFLRVHPGHPARPEADPDVLLPMHLALVDPARQVEGDRRGRRPEGHPGRRAGAERSEAGLGGARHAGRLRAARAGPQMGGDGDPEVPGLGRGPAPGRDLARLKGEGSGSGSVSRESPRARPGEPRGPASRRDPGRRDRQPRPGEGAALLMRPRAARGTRPC